jgi:hypothetical protein
MIPGAFTRRGVAVLAGVAAASLLATAALAVFGDLLAEPASFGPDAWSRSALGHRAFLELVRGTGRQVLLSRHRTADRAAGGAATLLLEPAVGPDDGRARGILSAAAQRASRLLVVLPKREGFPDPLRPRWVSSARLGPVAAAQRVLEAMEIEAEVVRPTASIERWAGALPQPTLDEPQLVRSGALTPLLASPQGILVGELTEGGWTAIVVTDPDVIANHGLGRGRNAALALALLERLGGEGPVVVDETLHGHEITPSLTRELLRFPLVLATLQAAAALLLLAWAALVRFGRPLPPEPLLAPGKAFLVENAAELLRAGGHAAEAARAYLRAAREEVLARLPPPGGAEGREAWLLRVEAARGRAGTLRRLEQRVARIEDGRRGAALEAVRAGQQIYRWREELTDGAAGDPRTRRGPPG